MPSNLLKIIEGIIIKIICFKFLNNSNNKKIKWNE